MEIRVGKYGRTNLGNIFIFAWLEIDGKRLENKVILGDGQKITNDFYYFAKDEKIVKHSTNIKDIVQAGDIIKYKSYKFSKFYDIGEVKEYEITSTELTGEIKKEKYLGINGFNIENFIIQEILTKEQFNQMKYIVGDE